MLYEGLGGGETRQLALIEGSVNNPQEPVRETFSAGLVANTNYSVLVSAQTPLWNSSTTPYNFCEYVKECYNEYLLMQHPDSYCSRHTSHPLCFSVMQTLV